MVLVLGGAHSCTQRVAFAHIGTVLGIAVIMSATIVVDASFLVEPYHGSGRTMQSRLPLRCVLACCRRLTRQAGLAWTMEAVGKAGSTRTR